MGLIGRFKCRREFGRFKRLRKKALNGLLRVIRDDDDLASEVACYASVRYTRIGGENVNWLDFLRDLPIEVDDVNGINSAVANLALTPPVRTWIEANVIPLNVLVHSHITPFEDPSEFSNMLVTMCRNLYYGGLVFGLMSASDAMSTFKKFDEFSSVVGEEFATTDDPD